jgi:hypothetical protein
MTLLRLRVRDLFLQLAAEAYCSGMSHTAAAECCTGKSLAIANAHGSDIAQGTNVRRNLLGASKECCGAC